MPQHPHGISHQTPSDSVTPPDENNNDDLGEPQEEMAEGDVAVAVASVTANSATAAISAPSVATTSVANPTVSASAVQNK